MAALQGNVICNVTPEPGKHLIPQSPQQLSCRTRLCLDVPLFLLSIISLLFLMGPYYRGKRSINPGPRACHCKFTIKSHRQWLTVRDIKLSVATFSIIKDNYPVHVSTCTPQLTCGNHPIFKHEGTGVVSLHGKLKV